MSLTAELGSSPATVIKMFTQRGERYDANVGVVAVRVCSARCRRRFGVVRADGVGLPRGAARRRAIAHHGKRFAHRLQTTPVAAQGRVYTPPPERSPDRAREGGAAARCVLQSDKHNTPAVLEDGRHGAGLLRPAAEVVQLVLPQRGECAAESLRYPHPVYRLEETPCPCCKTPC